MEEETRPSFIERTSRKAAGCFLVLFTTGTCTYLLGRGASNGGESTGFQ